MNSIEMLRDFFGWCSVINIGLLVVSSLMLMFMRGWITKIQAKMFGVRETDLSRIYINFLGNYKLLIFVFNLVPYIALRIIS